MSGWPVWPTPEHLGLLPGVRPWFHRAYAARGWSIEACLSLASTDTAPHCMSWKRKVHGGILGFIGFMLSPLSWWNDLFVNVPLAVAFAWVVSLVYKPAFITAAIVGYWLTNVLGFVLMHKGAQKVLTAEDKPYTARSFVRDLIVSLLYTLLIVVLARIGVLKPVADYFARQ